MPRTESQQQEKVLALLGGKIKSLGRKEMSHHCPQLGCGPGRVARPQELGTMAGSERNVGPGQPPTPPAPRTREGNSEDRGQDSGRHEGEGPELQQGGLDLGGRDKGQSRMFILPFLHPLNFLKL